MQLQLHSPESGNYVKRVGRDAVTVVDRDLTSSFLLSRETVVERWPVGSVSELEPVHVDAVLALSPDVVLLGTGERMAFPKPAVMAAFLMKGVGVEVMDNAAAARTFNVISAEGRRVVAAFILP